MKHILIIEYSLIIMFITFFVYMRIFLLKYYWKAYQMNILNQNTEIILIKYIFKGR